MLPSNAFLLLVVVLPCIVVGGEARSPLQYWSSRLVLSYRLPHDATLSDILPLPCFFPSLPPLRPPSTTLSISAAGRHPFQSLSSPSHPPPTTFMDAPHTPTPAPAPLTLGPTSCPLCRRLLPFWCFKINPRRRLAIRFSVV